MKECITCGIDLEGDFYSKNPLANKCYNCFKGHTKPKPRIKKLLKKYPTSSKLKDGREMVTNKKRKWAGFKYE